MIQLAAALGAPARAERSAPRLKPPRTREETLRKAGFALAGAGMLASELLRTPDPRSPLKGDFGLAKRVAWSAPVALADVKAIGAPLGAKINDVLVAGMTGALRTYLQRRGVDVDSHDGARNGAGGPAPAGARATSSATSSASCCWTSPSPAAQRLQRCARPRRTWTP